MGIGSMVLVALPPGAAREAANSPESVIEISRSVSGIRLSEDYASLEDAPSEAVTLLRSALGEALDLHTDPRGVLLLPDTVVPRGASYRAMVEDVQSEGTWLTRAMLTATGDGDEDDDGEAIPNDWIIDLGGVFEPEDGRPITHLDLHNTRPTAADIARLSSMRSLRSLNLSRVPSLTRTGLREIATLPALASLMLDELKLVDDDLAMLKRLSSLSALSVVKTRIRGTGFAALAELPALVHVTIGYTPLDDIGMKDIARLPHLETLNLAPSNITDAGVAHLAKHTKLRTLDISRTRITDAVVPSLLAIRSLEKVSLGSTALTPKALARLRERAGLTVVA